MRENFLSQKLEYPKKIWYFVKNPNYNPLAPPTEPTDKTIEIAEKNIIKDLGCDVNDKQTMEYVHQLALKRTKAVIKHLEHRQRELKGVLINTKMEESLTKTIVARNDDFGGWAE